MSRFFSFSVRLSLTLAVVGAVAVSVQAEDDLSLKQRELEQLQGQIQSLQAEAKERQAEVSEQRQALEETERKLGEQTRQLRATEARLAEARSRLDELGAEQRRLEQQLDDQREAMADLLRLAYKQNNQPLIKLLLSGRRPEALARQMHYFAILNEDQNAQLRRWIEQSERLAEVIDEQQSLTERLEADKQLLVDTREELAAQKNRRAQILANLEEEAEAVEQQLARKQAEQAQLNELVDRMEAELADLSLEFPEGIDMAEVKGKLPWPLEGRIRANYGTPINGSRLRWQGWLIGGDSGAEVQAVHHGRVVFADWLNGFGLLVILDHGDGMMSLYGRNQSLLRTVGEWVNAGDVISEVGLSGGFSEPGLYFELRRNGQPENPANWLKKR
ncbi:murein hydrolase activator EnvC family protein [Saccharospirillum salsuginis]|uniref:M23ase beta-sheet core domain-containing protein n=1 Tax=Saccharospirillum salsuginis TaxID=418750 RepID=A0A918K346_9GAMM|nr:peptidoglycan DD-metalloendopeptidase family protein [Saccharospirillum salsuginis]GGX46100.1 hypothetical protein GCM10007392_11430 [Saccharospirillum salsuginis]